MSGTQPVAVYAMKVPPGDILVPAVPDFAAMFRVSMAAIDPSAAPEVEDVDDKKPPRATLKIIRFPADLVEDDSDDEDYDFDEESSEEDEDDSDDEEANGGPSDKSKKPSKKDILRALAEAEAMEEDDDEDDSEDDEAAAKAILAKIKKGKGKLTGEEDDESDEDEDDESLEVDEVVVCTLDPEKNYQQPLDIVVGEKERIFFKVTGTHTVHLTGNYVIPLDDGTSSLYDDEDEDEYDLSPDEDELDDYDEDEESDELDDVADPRVMEVDTDEEEAPKLVKAAEGKGKNKRAAEESEEETLDDLVAKAGKEGEKLSKSQQKKLKKQKKNDGEAAAVTPEAAKPAANGEKKVQFAKNLEQGPTPSAATKDAKKETSAAGATGALGVKTVQGVLIDDKKLGKGPAAKKGDRVGMRYIGKLENGKVFDSNKKGKPFSFKLGAGDVIKGWDIGIAGLAVGGERRITIPANLGYGSKGAPPDIPPNAKLIFDVKMLEIK